MKPAGSATSRSQPLSRIVQIRVARAITPTMVPMNSSTEKAMSSRILAPLRLAPRRSFDGASASVAAVHEYTCR